MDEWLAEVYGTKGAQQQVDLEKVAQLAILEKLAGEEGYDLSNLTEEQAIELANEVMSAGAQGGEQPQGEPQPQQPQGEPQAGPTQEQAELELAKEAAAKFEEADFLGRVMAHAYTQELEKIGKLLDPSGTPHPESALKGPSVVDKAVAGAKGGASRLGELLAGGKKLMNPAHPSTTSRAGNLSAIKNLVAGGPGRAEALKSMGARAGVAAGAAGLGYGAYRALKGKSKTKEASAFEKLAEERAMEVLQANGIDPSTGQPMQDPQQDPQGQQAQPQGDPQQQQQTPDEQFEDALNARAAEMLQNAGYQIEA